MQLLTQSSRGQQEQGKRADRHTFLRVCTASRDMGNLLEQHAVTGPLTPGAGLQSALLHTIDPSFGSQLAADPLGPQTLA